MSLLPELQELVGLADTNAHSSGCLNMAKKKILCISYDESLLRTRQMLLERARFAVTPVIGFTEAIERCKAEKKFDLVLMGHSMPQTDKAALIAIIKKHCPAPLMSIRKHGEQPLPEAEFSLDSQADPAVFIEEVKAALST
jgi:CheY-like chemotaxis protein